MKLTQLTEQREVKESYDDYHGDMSKEEYDKTVKSSEMEYAVWVGGTEVNDNWLSYDEAVRLYDKYKAQGYDDVQLDARIKESVNEAEKRWKQTSMSPEEAIEKYGKENVKVKKGALRNGDDMVEVFVESYSPGDEYADSEGMVSNCCGAPMMDYNDGHGRCGDCKEMAAGETEEEYYESWDGVKSAVKKGVDALKHGGVKFGKKGVTFHSDLKKPKAVATKPQMENTYDTKDFQVNPRAGHRDQAVNEPSYKAHPIPGIKTKPKLRPKNLQMKYDINKAVHKAVKMDEDEEAIAARDEFMKVMDMKPKSSHKAIDTIKQIVADKQNMQVKFDDGKMKVDLYTASAVSQVYDAVNDANKEKIDNMLRTKEGMLRMSNFAFTKLSEQMEIIKEAEKEGRLDEVLPLAPLALGLARVVGGKLVRKYGPKVASAIAKKFPTVGAKVGDKVAKVGGNAIRTPGAGKIANTKAVGKAIKSKSPYLKTATGASAIDYATGGDGTGVDTYNRVTNRNSGGSNSSKKNGPMDNYADSVRKAWESKEDGENISEYTGKDAVLDKNGKPHDPRSSKGKMIINMKKKKPVAGEKETDKDKKRRNKALLKKGAGMARDGVEKLRKSATGAVAATGFVNPFEGIEDKASKMIEDAVKETEKMPKIDPSKIKTPTNIKVKGYKTDNYDDRIQRLARGNKAPKKPEPKDGLGPLEFKAKVEF